MQKKRRNFQQRKIFLEELKTKEQKEKEQKKTRRNCKIKKIKWWENTE